MKSRTSFYNGGIFASIIKRTWPLWFAYFFAWFLSLPLPTLIESGNYHGMYPGYLSGGDGFLSGCCVSGFAMAIIVAVAVFSFLFNSRSTGLIASLPAKREAVFCSAYLAGLLPVIAVNLLVVGLNILFSLSFLSDPEIELMLSTVMAANGYILAANVMCFVIFYGIAVLIAMVTGNIIALPVLYLIFNFLFVGMELVVSLIVSDFLYGFVSRPDPLLVFTCPLLYILQLEPNFIAALIVPADMLAEGMGAAAYFAALSVYCAVSIVFSVIALLMYRKHRMESAGDFISVPALRPVFKAGISVCAALCFGLFIRVMFSDSGLPALPVLIAGLFIGAFIGYFATQMLMRKSLNVFNGHWTGFAVLCALCVVFALCCRYDVLGVTRKLPDAAEVKEVYVGNGKYVMSDSETISGILEINRRLIDDRSVYENAEYDAEHSRCINVSYLLKNNSMICREYCVPDGELYGEFIKLINTPETVLQDFECGIPVTAGNIVSSTVWINVPDGVEVTPHELSPEQAEDFYRNALLPDIYEGNVSIDDYYKDPICTVYIEFEVGEGSDGSYSSSWDSLNVCVYRSYTHCIQWINDNVDADAKLPAA